MIEWILANGERTSIVTLLMIVAGLLALAWHREWFVLGKTHRWLIEDRDKEIERLRRDRDHRDEMNRRLLEHLERQVTVTEKIAPEVRKGTRKIELPPDEHE